MVKRTWAGIPVMLLAAYAQTVPDNKLGITIRTNTTLVQVRVIAQDSKGRPVTDLKREDFQVFDNGAKQDIAEFTVETAAIPTAAARKGAAPTAFPDDVVTPSEKSGGYAVVLLDFLNSGRQTAARAQQDVVRLLKNFDPSGKVALYLLDDEGLKELGDFGTDREALLAKIGKATGRPSPCSDNPWLDPSPQPPRKPRIPSADDRCEEGLFFFLYQRDVKTIETLERLADRLSFQPGRKALIWVTTASDVYNVSAKDQEAAPIEYKAMWPLTRTPTLDKRLENATRKLNNADVGIYTVDACGIDTPFDSCDSHREAMEDFAKRTGGKAFPRTNDLAGAMQRAAEDVRASYSLAFYAPADADLERFHNLKVLVNRPGIELSYRQGYSLGTAVTAASLTKGIPGAEARALRAKAFAPPSIFKELETLAAIPAAGNVGATMSAPYFYTAANVAVVDLHLEIAVVAPELNVVGEAVRPDGSVAARFTDTVKVKPGTEAIPKRAYPYEHQFRLASGKYAVRVAFGSGETALGRVEAALTVDGWDGKALAISSVALGRETRKADAAAAALDGRKALVSRAVEIVPAGSARFKRGEPCKAYFEIYDPAREAANNPKLSAQLRVLNPQNGAETVNAVVFEVDGLAKAGERMIPVSFSVPVDLLAPGKYELEVKAMRSSADAITRRVEFEVE